MNGGDRGWFALRFGSGGLLFVFQNALDEEGDGTFALGGFAYFGARGEDAQLGVGGDLFDDFDRFGFGVAVSRGFGEVETGDLEAVEEKAGAPGVDVVGGDAAENFADRVLDRGAVFGQRQVEGGAAALALMRVSDGFSGGVVVVAEVFSTQARAAAAVAVSEDMAALVLFGCFGCVLHGPSPWVLFVQSLRTRRDESGLPVHASPNRG